MLCYWLIPTPIGQKSARETKLRDMIFKNKEANINPLKPNDPYRGRTAPLTSKRCILYIYSTNTGTENLNMVYNLRVFFSSKCSMFHNSNVFDSHIIHIWYLFIQQIQVLNILNMVYNLHFFFSSKCSLFHNSNVFWFLYYSHFIYRMR